MGACLCNSARLVGSGLPWEGRLEIYSNDEWGTVSNRYHYYFDNDDAAVACRMLGFE